MTTTTLDDDAGGGVERVASVSSSFVVAHDDDVPVLPAPTPPIRTNKKRRISKKDRKALKRENKKRKKNRDEGSAAETSSSSAAPPRPKSSSSRHGSSSSDAEAGPSRADADGGGGEAGGGGPSSNDDDEEYAPGYVPVPIPDGPPPPDEVDDDGGGNVGASSSSKKTKTTLGNKWFPNAVTIKCSSNYSNVDAIAIAGKNDDGKGPKASLLLFYQYAVPPLSPSRVRHLASYLTTIAETRSIGGRVRISTEGLNCTLSSVDSSSSGAAATLRHFAMDLRRFSSTFSKTDFKYIDDLPPDRHFKDWKLLPVKELVHYGLTETEAPLTKGGVHVDPTKYHELLERDDAVVIDVRNHYEAVLGRFDGQTKIAPRGTDGKKGGRRGDDGDDAADRECGESGGGAGGGGGGGAEYVDPMMRKSTDFPSWVRSPSARRKLRNKTVLMYCTGGVRCERASAYLNATMGHDVRGVYQLKGGIERYLKQFPDGGHWRGKNFVFDKREAVGVGRLAGDGGVVVGTTKSSSSVKRKNAKSTDDDGERSTNGEKDNKEVPGGGEQAKCCVCSRPWDRYVGKKKCRTCGVPVLMCDACMSQKLDKRPGMELKVRCPLCVEGNVTVFNESVEWTENGVKGVASANDAAASKAKSRNAEGASDDGDAATTTANESKERRANELSTTAAVPDRNETTAAEPTAPRSAMIAAPSVLKWGGGHAREKKRKRKMKRTPCRFGIDCVRKDCFFGHPEREKKGDEGEAKARGTKSKKRENRKSRLE